MKNKLFILLLIVLGFGLYAQDTPQLSGTQLELYKLGFGIPKDTMAAPDFTTKDINGREVKLSTLKGKLVFLNLWATWCPPCRKEMPSIQRLYEKMDGNDFAILAVATPSPPRETKEKILSYVKDNKYTFPVMIDESQTAYGIYGSGSIPTTWLIYPDGTIAGRFVGAREWDTNQIIDIFKSIIADNK